MDMLISLLVPTLGERKNELVRLFDSIVNQSYKNSEVVVVSQDNHELVSEICDNYKEVLKIKHLKSRIKGLSLARNIGLGAISGDVVVLSDDDCWYPSDAVGAIASEFAGSPDTDLLLTQIFDPVERVLYKDYGKKEKNITKPVELLSRSSIELAFRKDENILFDELFGLGGVYQSCEENDFLIRYLKAGKKILYAPIVTVYHKKKQAGRTQTQLTAKGAFYSKNFGFIVSNVVLLRDLIKKKQNNYKFFWQGYFDYRKRKKM